MSNQYKQEVLLFMYGFILNRPPVSFSNIFHNNHGINDQHSRRQADLFLVASTKSKFVDKLPLYGYPTLGNICYPVLYVNICRIQ